MAKQKKLSENKVRCEIWMRPEDERKVQRLARQARMTRAGWMRAVILAITEAPAVPRPSSKKDVGGGVL